MECREFENSASLERFHLDKYDGFYSGTTLDRFHLDDFNGFRFIN